MKKVAIWLVEIILAAAIISWIIIKHKENFLENLKTFELEYFLFAVLLLLIHMTVCGVRWYGLLKLQRVDISFKETMVLNFKSFFLSLVIPGGTIGGDVAKVAMVSSKLPKGARFEPVFCILIDRIIGMIGLFLLALLAIGVSFRILMQADLSELGFAHELNVLGIGILVLICVGGLLMSVFLFFHKQFEKVNFVSRMIPKIDKLSRGYLNRCFAAVDLYSKNWKVLLLWVLLTTVFVHLMMVAICYVLAIGFGVKVVSFSGFFAAVILGSIAGLLPFTPSGLGMRDYVMLLILSAAAIEGGATIAVLLSMVVIASNLLGGLAFLVPSIQVDTRKDEKKMILV